LLLLLLLWVVVMMAAAALYILLLLLLLLLPLIWPLDTSSSCYGTIAMTSTSSRTRRRHAPMHLSCLHGCSCWPS
jgi:hypothetical protein